MPEQQQTLTIQQAIDLGVQHHNAGDLTKAEGIYQQILQSDPDQPVALHLLGVIAHQVGKNDVAVDLITKALAIKPDYAEAHSNLGLALHGLDKLEEAVTSYHTALTLKPDYPEAHNNLGNVLLRLGRIEDAMASYQKTLGLKSDYAEAHNNFGTALHDCGKLEEAVTSFQTALDLKPDYAEAHYNLGNALHGLDRPERAVASYHTALTLKPDYPEANNNLGNALRSLGRLDDAMASYQKTLGLKPDYVEVHNNLGNALMDLGNLDEAVASFQKALSIKPDFFQGLNGLGNTLRNLGQLDDAITSYRKALAIKPNYARTHTNLGKEPQAESHNPAPNSNSLEDIIALLTVGRSGSLLFHSLFDGHPDIATLPSIYFQGYFGSKVWRHIYGDPGNPRWREIATTAVVKHFGPVFDARSEQPLFGDILLYSDKIGHTTGCTAMGEAGDQVLTLDRITFSKHLLHFLSKHNQLDPKLLFKLIHLAFEKTLDRGIVPKNIFYHIHNPTTCVLANFLAAFPRTRFLVTIREPVQNLESWVALCTHRPTVKNIDHENFLEHRLLESEYLTLVKVLTGVNDQASNTAFLCFDSAAVRLEDIKLQSKTLMPQVAKWIGIPDHPSLYQSTFQGLTYWGPYSPLNPQIRGFDPKSVRRKPGIIFSEKDIWIFTTLFYYFRTHYGYQDEDEKNFRTDLKKIGDMLDEPFDFERQWVHKRSNGLWKPQDFYPFHVLRNKIKFIWQLVNQQKTFYGMPVLIKPKI